MRIEAENAIYIQRQHDFTDLMKQKRKKAEAQRAVIKAKKQLKQISQKKKEQEKILAAATAARTYTPGMLGQDQPNGGFQGHMKKRYEVLDRIKAIAYLTHPQSDT